MGDLKDVMSRWKPWVPPKQDQAFQQGGMFVFKGNQCVWCHYDKATGAHADLAQVLGVAAEQVAAAGVAAVGLDCECGDGGAGLPLGTPQQKQQQSTPGTGAAGSQSCDC
jgi:hypothetical protein